jgi:polysaccharide export outer membrane protein
MQQVFFALCLIAAAGVSQAAQSDQPSARAQAPSGYILGPNDQITVSVVELPEFSARPYRIDDDGTVSLPLLGRVQAGGLTLVQFEANLRKALEAQVRTPHITANVSETRTQPVSVMGAVNTPGTQQIQGSRTLFDVLAAAGGLKPEAGDTVTVTHHVPEGSLNVPEDAERSTELKVRDVVELRDPKANILIRPYDQVMVSKAPVLYVIGNVHKPGGFTLERGKSVSALEALSFAEGLAPNASPGGARILRKESDAGARKDIPVNLKQILAGKGKDVQLYPNDILYVPDNTTQRVTTKILETTLATISGVIIWRGI